MNVALFDIAVLFVILISCITALYSGLISIIASLLCICSSVMLSIKAYPFVSGFFNEYIKIDLINCIVSGVVSYAMIFFVCSFFFKKFELIFGNIKGSFCDRSFGLVFGFVRAVAIILVMLWALVLSYNIQYLRDNSLKKIMDSNAPEKYYPSWASDSISLKYLNKILVSFIEYIPSSVVNSVETQVGKINK